jgi:hypothetical protein
MTTKTVAAAKDPFDAARQALSERLDHDAFLAKFGAKDRATVERHLAAIDLEPDGAAHAVVWTRLARAAMTLAPHMPKAAQKAVQFFTPDGKYRLQVFALEDARDGKLAVYVPDVLDAAIRAKLLVKPQPSATAGGAVPNSYRLADSRDLLQIEPLDNANTNSPAPYFKDMLGWNRKALRITVPINATETQLDATEALLVLAAKAWADKAATA